MRMFASTLVAVLIAGTAGATEVITATPLKPTESEMKVAVLCFFKGEETSGMNKICYYDCLGSLAAITISSVRLCPLSINN